MVPRNNSNTSPCSEHIWRAAFKCEQTRKQTEGSNQDGEELHHQGPENKLPRKESRFEIPGSGEESTSTILGITKKQFST